MYVPDNLDHFERHMGMQEKMLARLPVCRECKERIQTEWLYEIDDEFICENCMDEHKKSADSVIW